jgi:clathrin heavy chain
VDIGSSFAVTRKTMKAENILVHPQNLIIAARAKAPSGSCFIQIFDMKNEKKVSQAEVKEDIEYWAWLNNTTLGVVGTTSVYHVEAKSGSVSKIFDRAAQLNGSHIMGYSMSKSGNWAILHGIGAAEDKSIVGNMQLYSIEKSQQQILEGFCGTFSDVCVCEDPEYSNSLFSFVEKKKGQPNSTLRIMEIGNPNGSDTKFKQSAQFAYPPDVSNDFPVVVHAAEKYGVLFIVTKFGYLFVYVMGSAALIYRQKITTSLIFRSVKNTKTDGCICVNRDGQLLAINVDQQNLINYIMNKCTHLSDNVGIAFKMAQRYSLPGAENLFVAQFNKLFGTGDYKGAAKIAREAPGDTLRNNDTISKFKSVQAASGPPPILVYFSTLLETTKLNAIESLELVKPVLAQGKKQVIEDWIKKKKLTITDELAEMIKQVDPKLGLSCYIISDNPDQVVQGLVETSQFDKIQPYLTKSGKQCDFLNVIRNITPRNAEAALGLAKWLYAQGPNMISTESVAGIFIDNGRIQEATAFLLEALKGNRPEEGHLQTKLLEINLRAAPNVAEAIFQMNQFTHYDREKIGKMCEQAGLYGRALEHHNNVEDIKRAILNVHAIPREQMIAVFKRLDPEDAFQSLDDLMRSNRQNVQRVAEVAIGNFDRLDSSKIIQLFEHYQAWDGMFYYLGHILPQTEDEDCYFKYIQAAAKLQKYQELEKVIKSTSHYDPVKVKDFLMDTPLQDPRPLIYLCDLHGFVPELTRYLYKAKKNRFIEIYVLKVNNAAAPKVLGTLIDLDCDEIYVKQLLNSIRACPIDELVEEFDSRNKRKELQSWLQARANEGVQEPALHNAIAMNLIDNDTHEAENFLINNPYYDSRTVGKYAEDRNSDLAFISYRRAWGSCDDELIEVSNRNYLYRLQAKYLVERKDAELWAKVLNQENEHKQAVIDKVVQFALPESDNTDEVATTVKAFMDADMPSELIELLEKIVLHNSDFSSNQDLQNLLILTAIKADRTKVMDYVNRLDNFDGDHLAEIALNEKYQLYDEALAIYKKCDKPDKAVGVLITYMQDLSAAQEFADKANRPDVWSRLGEAYLNENQIENSIECFIKANDPNFSERIIGLAEAQDAFEPLVKYLLMARQTKQRDAQIDGELIYAYAHTDRLDELQDFISEPNQADIQKCGDRCYEERLFEAAKILYTSIGHNQKLASTLVFLKEYQGALDAAKKANIPKVWKEVAFACIRSQEFRLAAIAGLNIVIHPDNLDDLIHYYEKFGYYKECIQLLESGLSLERSHMGIYTELGVLYAKYDPDRLMDHIRTYAQKINIPKLIRACQKWHMWPEAVFLYAQYEEYDNAVMTMIEHSPSCWRHDLFVQHILKVANLDLYYRALIFYLEEQPMLLNDLLKLLAMKIDLPKCVSVMRKAGHLTLIEPFLKSVQNQNIGAVNEALNEIYVENEDYESLRTSITEYDNFESLNLAKELENHDLLEFRRIAAIIYRKNNKWEKSLEISKKDELWKDSIETVSESKDIRLTEDLLRFFMETGEPELFAAMLYTCYELIKPDVAMEVAWRFGLNEYAMPYFIQFLKDLSSRVEVVQKKTDDIEKKKDDKAKEEAESRLQDIDMGFMFPGQGGPQIQAIMPSPGVMPGGMGFMGQNPNIGFMGGGGGW